MAILVELPEVCLLLACWDHVCLLALAFIVAASQEHKLAAFFHVLVKHGVRYALAVYPKRLDHILVVLSTLLEGPVGVCLEIQGILSCTSLLSLAGSRVGILVGGGNWV